MKVCQTCGARYKDVIDFCFDDGQVLSAMTEAYDAVDVSPIFTDDDSPEEPTESGPIADPGLVGVDDLAVDEEPTQRTDSVEVDDDLTVPRVPSHGGDHASPERTSPTESDTDPALASSVPVASLVTEVTDPSLLEAPVTFEDESSDDEDTPVLQEPVLAVVPPGANGPNEYETANTVVPSDSFEGPRPHAEPLDDDDDVESLLDPEDDEDEPAPLSGGGPTLAPSPAPQATPPPVPVGLGQKTLPLHEVRSQPAAVETKPLRPRPSSTPTLPAIQLRPAGPAEPEAETASGTGILVLGLGAFAVSAAFVLLLFVVAWATGSFSSGEAVADERRATLPERGPMDPIPPPEFELPDDEGLDEGDEMAAEGESDPVPRVQRATARESKSITIVENLSGATDGTGTRPVLFESTPANARVELEGHDAFRTPYEIRLNIGETYRYTVSFPGYDPVRNEFSVMSGTSVLHRRENLDRTPTAVAPPREGPIVLGPTGCRLRVDGQLMRAEDIVGGTTIDEKTGRAALFLPFQLKGAVLGQDPGRHTFQVVPGVDTPTECGDYRERIIEYKGQASIFLGK